jgi:hypothetical protein
MLQDLFVKIVQPCKENCRYFTRRRDSTDLLGFSSHQKISAAMWVAYGIPIVKVMILPLCLRLWHP